MSFTSWPSPDFVFVRAGKMCLGRLNLNNQLSYTTLGSLEFRSRGLKTTRLFLVSLKTCMDIQLTAAAQNCGR